MLLLLLLPMLLRLRGTGSKSEGLQRTIESERNDDAKDWGLNEAFD